MTQEGCLKGVEIFLFTYNSRKILFWWIFKKWKVVWDSTISGKYVDDWELLTSSHSYWLHMDEFTVNI